MSDREYRLFESLVHITEERDKKSLEKVLVKTLFSLLDCDALILIRIPIDAHREYSEVAVSIPETAAKERLQLVTPHENGNQLIHTDSCIDRCIHTEDVIQDNRASTSRSLFPITVSNKVVSVLDIYGHHRTIKSEKLISGFIRVYSNFQSIINDNEHDTLTGLLNRKTFDTQLTDMLSTPSTRINDEIGGEEKRKAKSQDTSHWLGILDIDHFKSINDNFGHIYGDEVLLLFSKLMKESFRSSDLLFRYGGEEFVVVLKLITEEEAFNTFERFRKALELVDFPQVGRVTVSTGIIKMNAQEHATVIIEHADKALYYAKEHGRNRVCNYNKLIEQGELKENKIEGDIELF